MKVRLDKWLWAVRICKTRTIATDLCKRQRVTINGQYAKPSRDISPGDLIVIKKDGIEWQYKVLQGIDKRVGAKIAAQACEDVTPAEALAKFKMVKSSWVPRRDKGAGRPTKKDRREMERFLDSDKC
ncbi:MAG: RNA-binding S4 domain-containing protein [Candidatus Omnitrophica bacterium]|nr:RNA-binding S4 domain-containing protein [Candidatus Omnitrophota bacterium]MCB9747834.1 RNA-binding S4 domain-containing protein [Candidatus Omnitrophota bacterium]